MAASEEAREQGAAYWKERQAAGSFGAASSYLTPDD